MLVSWGLDDLEGGTCLVEVLEDGVIFLAEELGDLLEFVVQLNLLPCFVGFFLLDSLRGWLQLGQETYK